MTAKNDDIKYLIGVDEVGRGPIAGPVAVCAFIIKNDISTDSLCGGSTSPSCEKEERLPRLKDSKKLSKKQREIWFEHLKKKKEEGLCDYAVSFVSPESIDKYGIAKCIQKALDESLDKVTSQKELLASFRIFLDGGLHASKEYINQETIIRGDELHPIISMASIMAKVTRDRVMTNFAKEYKDYGFEKHMGYGTKAHYDAIGKCGLTPIHRRSFIHSKLAK